MSAPSTRARSASNRPQEIDMHAIRPPKTAIAFAFALQLAGSCLAADAVADSFARMLAHEPNRVAPAVPAGLGADPLIAAMAEPLRQWLAQPDAAPRYAGCTPAGTVQRAGVCSPARLATPLD
jgi:hypothetical protein